MRWFYRYAGANVSEKEVAEQGCILCARCDRTVSSGAAKLDAYACSQGVIVPLVGGVVVRRRALRSTQCKRWVLRLVHPFSLKCNRLRSFEIGDSAGLLRRQGTV